MIEPTAVDEVREAMAALDRAKDELLRAEHRLTEACAHVSASPRPDSYAERYPQRSPEPTKRELERRLDAETKNAPDHSLRDSFSASTARNGQYSSAPRDIPVEEGVGATAVARIAETIRQVDGDSEAVRKQRRNERDRRNRERKKAEKSGAAQSANNDADPDADQSTVYGETDAPTEPTEAPKGLPPPDDAGKPFWTREDVDDELMHALHYGGLAWAAIIADGADDAEILRRLRGWPRGGRVFVPPQTSGGKYGYTIWCVGKTPTFWVGSYHGLGHKPTLEGPDLVRRVRSLLEIPTPREAAMLREPSKVIAAGTGFTTPEIDVATFIVRPPEGWDSGHLGNAAETLGIARADQIVICKNCEAARANTSACPECGSTHWRLTSMREVLGERGPNGETISPEHPPARERRKPSRERKAAHA
jgi:hypothetical protein